MSGKCNCYDNSAVKSFFKSLKAELVWRRNWQTRREVEVALFEYINGFYNPRRKHSALGWILRSDPVRNGRITPPYPLISFHRTAGETFQCGLV